jgi:hypothetical protein
LKILLELTENRKFWKNTEKFSVFFVGKINPRAQSYKQFFFISEKFSVKARKIWTLHFFHEHQKKMLCWCFGLAKLVHVWKCSSKLFRMTLISNTSWIFRYLKFCTEFRAFFCVLWLLGLRPGLNPINKKFQIWEIFRK